MNGDLIAVTGSGHRAARASDVGALRGALQARRSGLSSSRLLSLLSEDDEDRLYESLRIGSQERYEELVAPHTRLIGAAHFDMGTKPSDARHFCGEIPRHRVDLSPFEITEVPVTNELYALFDEDRSGTAAPDRSKPVTDVSWLEADMFAVWIGCRLPTEAEWEYACGAGGDGEWWCGGEEELYRYGWYSENASGELHPVATREPNSLGLFDLHGNVWEWCADLYSPDYYLGSPRQDPVNDAWDPTKLEPHRVCRGGSMHALAEMCRTRYRFHEPAHFWARDLGFRLAKSQPAP